MKSPIQSIVIIILLLFAFQSEAQNRIYLVSKVNNYTTFKLKGYNNLIFSSLIWYRVNTMNRTYKGLVRFNDSSLVIKRTSLSYDSIVSIEYSKFNKTSNAIRLGCSSVLLAFGTALVTRNNPTSFDLSLGLVIGVPGAIGTGFSIYETAKPSVYMLDDYYIHTKKGSR